MAGESSAITIGFADEWLRNKTRLSSLHFKYRNLQKENAMARTASRHANGGARGAYGTHPLYKDFLALAGSLVRNRKDSGASALGSMADATRDYASQLEMPTVSTYVASAANQLEYLSDYVMHNELETMIHDAGSFARRHPVAAFGLAAVTGFGITRMVGLNNGHSGRARASTSRKTPRRRRARKTKANGVSNG